MASNDWNRTFVFDYTNSKPAFTNNMTTEYPSNEITVRIRLNPSSISSDSLYSITSDLRTKNMKLDRSRSSSDIIIISGIPPTKDFDRRKVLKIVQKYNKGAQFD